MGRKTKAVGEATDIIENTKILMDPLKFLVSYYRPTWLVIITMAFLPPYRSVLYSYLLKKRVQKSSAAFADVVFMLPPGEGGGGSKTGQRDE